MFSLFRRLSENTYLFGGNGECRLVSPSIIHGLKVYPLVHLFTDAD